MRPRLRSADSRLLVERAKPLPRTVRRGAAAGTTPRAAAEGEVIVRGRVKVTHWILDEPFWVMGAAGKA